MLALGEREVQAVVDGLMKRQLVLEKSGFGSRVPKYQHLFCNTQFGSLKFSPQQARRSSASCCCAARRRPANCARTPRGSRRCTT